MHVFLVSGKGVLSGIYHRIYITRKPYRMYRLRIGSGGRVIGIGKWN